MSEEKKDISVEIVKVLREDKTGKSGAVQLRIVRWVIDGKANRPALEKRGTYTTDSGEARSSKAQGLTYEDVKLVVSQWAEIEPLLKG
ncbi:MAG: hypothetical protein AAB368_16460 [bacterium]